MAHTCTMNGKPAQPARLRLHDRSTPQMPTLSNTPRQLAQAQTAGKTHVYARVGHHTRTSTWQVPPTAAAVSQSVGTCPGWRGPFHRPATRSATTRSGSPACSLSPIGAATSPETCRRGTVAKARTAKPAPGKEQLDPLLHESKLRGKRERTREMNREKER